MLDVSVQTPAPTPTDSPGYISDHTLLSRIMRGDEAALALLYDRYCASVYALALRIVGERPGAEAVTQEVFRHAWRSAAQIRQSADIAVCFTATTCRFALATLPPKTSTKSA